MSEPTTSATDAPLNEMVWLNWVTRTALVVLALSIVAAQAPPRIKLLGLFSIVIGGGMGTASAFLTKPHPTRVPRLWLALLFVMALAGLTGSTWLAFRSDTSSQSKSPNQQMAETMLKQMERDSAGEVNPVPIASTTDDFRWYLTRRVKQLGNWISPWPELFWAGELLFGGAAAAWCFRFCAASSRITLTSGKASS